MVDRDDFPGYPRALILDELGVKSIIAGFILKEIGVIAPDAEIVVRSDRRVSDELRQTSQPLYRSGDKSKQGYEDPLNPGWLQQQIARSTLHQKVKYGLRRFALALEPYRQ